MTRPPLARSPRARASAKTGMMRSPRSPESTSSVTMMSTPRSGRSTPDWRAPDNLWMTLTRSATPFLPDHARRTKHVQQRGNVSSQTAGFCGQTRRQRGVRRTVLRVLLYTRVAARKRRVFGFRSQCPRLAHLFTTSRAISHSTLFTSQAYTFDAPALAAMTAKIPVPVPMSSTVTPACARNHEVSANQTSASRIICSPCGGARASVRTVGQDGQAVASKRTSRPRRVYHGRVVHLYSES